jgi:hypothetical protein
MVIRAMLSEVDLLAGVLPHRHETSTNLILDRDVECPRLLRKRSYSCSVSSAIMHQQLRERKE